MHFFKYYIFYKCGKIYSLLIIFIYISIIRTNFTNINISSYLFYVLTSLLHLITKITDRTLCNIYKNNRSLEIYNLENTAI